MQQLYTAACAGGQAKEDCRGFVRLYAEMAGFARAMAEDAGPIEGAQEEPMAEPVRVAAVGSGGGAASWGSIREARTSPW